MHAWRPRGAVQFGLVAGPLAFLALFFAWPVGELLLRGFGDGADLGDVFGSSSIRSAIWFTLWQAVVSTLATVAVAFPLTWAIATVRFPGRRAVRALVTVPFVLPTVVVAGAFLATGERLGLEEGPFALDGTVFAIIVAHVFFNVAVIVRTVGSYWSQLSADDEHAARMLGASPLRAFATITVPRLRPAIAAAVAIVFLFTFTSFGVVLILGSARQRTIETEIFRYAISRTDFATAAVLSVLQIVVVLGLVFVNQRIRGRLTAGGDRLSLDRARRPETRRQWAIAAAILVVSLGLLAVPVVSLVDQSLRSGDGWSLANYRALADRPPFLTVTPLRAIGNSVFFAGVAALLATVIGGWASMAIAFSRRAVGRAVDVAFLLPLGVSAVTLGFGVLLAFDSGVFDLRQSWFIIPLVQSLIGVPFVTRAVAPVLQAIDPHLREAARSLGADPRTVLRDIDLPIARRALTVGAGFAFAISLGEFGATSFVGRRPDLMTVPLAIARLLGQPGQQIRGQAMALSVVLMLLTAGALLILDRADRTVL